MIIPNQALKKTINIYDLDGLRVIIARKVENPPWNILEPICPRAFFTL